MAPTYGLDNAFALTLKRHMPTLVREPFAGNIYIAEDFSKKVKDKRTELQKFMRKMKKRQPLSKAELKYPVLYCSAHIF